VRRPESDTGPIIEPQTTPLRLLLGNLQSLLTPDAFNTLVIHLPAFSPQKDCNSTITITPVCAGKPDNFSPEQRFIVCHNGTMSLGRSGLANHSTGTTLRYAKFAPQVFNALPAPGGA
jgi:hypothetical protein